MRKEPDSAGFTFIELTVTMMIVSIIMALSISAIKSSSTPSEANSLLGMIQFARSVAVKQGQSVIVCPSTNPSLAAATCSTATSWSVGWIVLIPASGLCSATGGATGDVVLQFQPKLTSTDTATFSASSGNSNTSFCFNRLGFSAASNTGKVTFKTSPAVAAKQRCTAVSGVGHAQVITQGSTDALGITCP